MGSEKQDNNTSQTIGILKLKQDMKELKRKKYSNQLKVVQNDLYLKENNPAEIEALLIKATEDKFGNETLKADSVLVSLGLVNGYGHYGHNNFDSKKHPITERYKKFLRESSYISAESEYTQYSSYEEAADAKEESKKKDGTIVDKEALETIRSTLGTNVGRWIEEVADYLDEQHKDERWMEYLDVAVKEYPSTNPDHIPDDELPPLRNPRKDIDGTKGEIDSSDCLKIVIQEAGDDGPGDFTDISKLKGQPIADVADESTPPKIKNKTIKVVVIASVILVILMLATLVSRIVLNKNSKQIEPGQIQHEGVTYSEIQQENVSSEDVPLNESIFEEVFVCDDEENEVKRIRIFEGESSVLSVHFSPNDAPKSKLRIDSEDTSILNIRRLDTGIPNKLPFVVKTEMGNDVGNFPIAILVEGPGAIPACVNVYIDPNNFAHYSNKDIQNSKVSKNGGMDNEE